MSGRRILMVGAAVALAATLAVVLATLTSASKPGALARISNQGRHVTFRTNALTRNLGIDEASLLTERGGRAYYLLQTQNGPCGAVGQQDKPDRLGAAQCPQGHFPTAEYPVLDLSVYESATHELGTVSLYRAEGIAADGVAAVQFLRPDGSTALTVPVSGNVYATTSVPSDSIAGVAAVDRGGKRIWKAP